jgi:hypothetical protein
LVGGVTFFGGVEPGFGVVAFGVVPGFGVGVVLPGVGVGVVDPGIGVTAPGTGGIARGGSGWGFRYGTGPGGQAAHGGGGATGAVPQQPQSLPPLFLCRLNRPARPPLHPPSHPFRLPNARASGLPAIALIRTRLYIEWSLRRPSARPDEKAAHPRT